MDKNHPIISSLEDIFHRWQELIAGLPEGQIQHPLSPSQWTIKDVVAHLWSWQQASVARAHAAIKGGDPDYPAWWNACGPDPEEDVDRTNTFIYAANRAKTWETVFTEWKEQFQLYLELLRQIPEVDLMKSGRYPWMGSYALYDSALGSCNHHLEHYEVLTAWLKEHPYSQG